MPILHIVRHAKSSRDDPGLDDHDRPLAGRGRRVAPAMATWMVEHGVAPRLVLVSTARRCRETWAAMQPAFAPRPEVAFEADLYLASSEELLARLRRLPDEDGEVMLIGHNPGLQDLAVGLAGSRSAPHAKLAAKFPTGALCSFAFDGKSWRSIGLGQARITHFIRPADVLEG